MQNEEKCKHRPLNISYHMISYYAILAFDGEYLELRKTYWAGREFGVRTILHIIILASCSSKLQSLINPLALPAYITQYIIQSSELYVMMFRVIIVIQLAFYMMYTM